MNDSSIFKVAKDNIKCLDSDYSFFHSVVIKINDSESYPWIKIDKCKNIFAQNSKYMILHKFHMKGIATCFRPPKFRTSSYDSYISLARPVSIFLDEKLFINSLFEKSRRQKKTSIFKTL